MKNLFLKNGIDIPVTLSEDEKVKYIAVYSYHEPGEHPALLFSIADGGFNNSNVIFADGLTELPFYMVSAAAEIIEHFNQYFNLLNQ